MNLAFYRAFQWDGHSTGSDMGGPLHVPRNWQGSSRHDIPERDGIIYGSLVSTSCVAEAIKPFRGQILTLSDLQRANGNVVALAHFISQNPLKLIDLDDPQQLTERGLAPSQVASPRRSDTQEIARRLYDEGLDGFLWWSTLNSTWKNVTLFENRVRPHLKIDGKIATLTLKHPDILEAAKELSIGIEK